ncbi:hypothetical protein ACSBOB_19565 [Mesorhizobium sp. ASY16-5R]|uniref:hypothetical protein n=1 Tax=Mesorhizobium sp. ASY16-5R TaxID=3445772 RepID=UPI003FA0D7C7
MFSFSHGPTPENLLVPIADELGPVAAEIDDATLRRRLDRFMRENLLAIEVRRAESDEWLALFNLESSVDIRALLTGTLRRTSWSQHLGEWHEAQVYVPLGMGEKLRAALLVDLPQEPNLWWLNHQIPESAEPTTGVPKARANRGRKPKAQLDRIKKRFFAKCEHEGSPDPTDVKWYPSKAETWLAEEMARDTAIGYTPTNDYLRYWIEKWTKEFEAMRTGN